MPTPRTTVRRLPDRGVYDGETIAAILDEGLVCHVGFVADGQPFVIPTIYARDGERIDPDRARVDARGDLHRSGGRLARCR